MDFRPNVERGMAWLDEHRPGWEHRIDLRRLDLDSTCDCLLGQEFDLESRHARFASRKDIWGWDVMNGYDVGFEMIAMESPFLRNEDHMATIKQARNLGFAAESDDDYEELTNTWRKAIETRLTALDIPHDKLEQQPAKTELATAS